MKIFAAAVVVVVAARFVDLVMIICHRQYLLLLTVMGNHFYWQKNQRVQILYGSFIFRSCHCVFIVLLFPS